MRHAAWRSLIVRSGSHSRQQPPDSQQSAPPQAKPDEAEGSPVAAGRSPEDLRRSSCEQLADLEGRLEQGHGQGDDEHGQNAAWFRCEAPLLSSQNLALFRNVCSVESVSDAW